MLFAKITAHSAALNDTIPPVFTDPPRDITVFCTEDIDLAFDIWYSSNASAEADNGEAEVFCTLDAQPALDSLASALTSCSMTGSLTLSFFALDSCDLASADTLQASFIVIDELAPSLSLPASSPALSCNEFTQDSLISWISNAGNALFEDNCSDSIILLNYIWNDSNGDSGFGSYEDSIVIEIPRSTCLWSADFTFFIQDECGNINNTNATFAITGDDQFPELIFAPGDTTVLCDAIPSPQQPVFIDGCDGILDLDFVEQSNQSANPASCEFYDFDLTRTWTGQDACGNMVEYVQNIIVRDTIAPMVNFENIIAKDCDDDLDDIDGFIEAFDNCATANVSYSDSIVSTTTCISSIIRDYSIFDFCDNRIDIRQQIQIEDFSAPVFVQAPQNMEVDCGVPDLESEFQNWLLNSGNALVEDNCNSLTIYPRDALNLTDSLSIVEMDEPLLEFDMCLPGLTGDRIFEKEIRFYAIDQCGNISSQAAIFSLIDTVAPVIPNCPRNQEIFLSENECEREITIIPPFAVDECLDNTDFEWTIRIDDVFELDNVNQSIEFNLEIGDHNIEYILSDCADNEISCTQTVQLIDTFPPIMDCPDNIEVFLESNQCIAELILPDLDEFDENCFGKGDFQAMQPPGDAFLNFEQDPIDESYSAKSFVIEFDNIERSQNYFKPSITIEYQLNIDVPSRVVLKSELSEDLFIAQKAPCVRQKEKIIIDEDQFAIWTLDGEINFGVSVEERGGKGILPCQPELLDGSEDIDELSFFKITLEYTEVDPKLSVFNEQGQLIFQDEKEIQLESGSFTAIYETEDFAGNIAQCTTLISVRDTISPNISCSDQVIVLTPDTDEFIDIILDDLNIVIEDNCGIDRTNYFPSDFSCQQIDRIVPVVVQAWDLSDNFKFCTANISVEAAELEPQFIGGLCLADTLKLFANIDANINGDFNWTGPADFESNDRNPVITNISAVNSGRYFLELVTDIGCPFSGSVEVEVSAFLSPQITAFQNTICEGEELLLNSNSYSEQVSYFWYEGISPNGTFLEETTGPSLQLSPDFGSHFYYVLVEGENCSSNPSNTIQIDVIGIPEVELEEQFVSVCANENINLGVANPNLDYIYNWSGPDGYLSTGPSPQVINNADIDNAGIYMLTVANQSCVTDEIQVLVEVNDLPDIPEIISQNVYCEEDPLILSTATNTTVESYDWFLDGEFYSNTNSNELIVPELDNSLSGNWTVVANGTLCSSLPSDVFPVIVETMPNIGASNNGPVCEGDSIRITASFLPDAFYEWTDPDGNTFFDREIQALALPGLYVVSITTPNGCSTSASTLVEVGSRPQVTALSNNAIECMELGDTITFFPTVFPPGNYSYSWTGPENFESNLENPIVIASDSGQNGIYELNISDQNCDSEDASTELDFIITPETVQISGITSLCSSEDLLIEILNPSLFSNTTWLWDTPIGRITTTEPILELQSGINSLQGEYSVVQQIENCRSEQSNILKVSYIDNGFMPAIIANPIACEGSSLILQTNTMEEGEYLWILPSGDTVITEQALLEITNFSSEDAGDYTVLIGMGSCLSVESDTWNIELVSEIEAPIIISDDLDLCLDEETSFEICIDDNVAGFSKLEIIDVATGLVIAETDETCIVINMPNNGVIEEFEFAARLDVQGCISQLSNIYNVNLYPASTEIFGFGSSEFLVCNETSFLLTLNESIGNLSYEWQIDDPNVTAELNGNEIIFSNLSSGETEILLNAVGSQCGIIDSESITLNILEDIVAVEDQFIFEYTDDIVLEPLINDIFFGNVLISDLDVQRLDNYSIEDNIIKVDNPESLFGRFDITYTICYEDCPQLCSSNTIILIITDTEDCITGNIITPNDDGYNDFFNIPCLDNAYPDNSVIIYNQWGDEVYSSAPYNNDWAGTFLNEPLPSGTYFYWLDLGDGSQPKNGFIVLER